MKWRGKIWGHLTRKTRIILSANLREIRRLSLRGVCKRHDWMENLPIQQHGSEHKLCSVALKIQEKIPLLPHSLTMSLLYFLMVDSGEKRYWECSWAESSILFVDLLIAWASALSSSSWFLVCAFFSICTVSKWFISKAEFSTCVCQWSTISKVINSYKDVFYLVGVTLHH